MVMDITKDPVWSLLVPGFVLFVGPDTPEGMKAAKAYCEEYGLTPETAAIKRTKEAEILVRKK